MFITILLLLLANSESGAAIPASERAALIALYNSTNGTRWKDSTGWLGEVGTECNWFGVDCSNVGGTAHVTKLQLLSNKLSGQVPPQLSDLTRLQLLLLQDNNLSGVLSEEVLRRWDAGILDLRFATSLTRVSTITFNYSTNVFCANEHALIKRDGSIEWRRELCRQPKKKDPEPFCEIRYGKTADFDRLARFLETHGFFDEHHADSTGPIWVDVPVTEITALRDGVTSTREIGTYGSGSLNEWAFQNAIRGVISAADWQKTITKNTCRD